MARTFYDKEEEEKEGNTSHESKKESPEIAEKTSPPFLVVEDYKPQQEEISSGDDSLLNSIPVDETLSKETVTPDSYLPDFPNFVPQQVYPVLDLHRMLPPPPPPPQNIIVMPPFFGRYAPFADDRFTQSQDETMDSDEVVLDPDNFEYFKGVRDIFMSVLTI